MYSRGAGGRSQRRCTRKHPPGRKVYQRGAHTIWEVDGTKEKVRTHRSPSYRLFTLGEQLYCQNLSLFGKLFIDIKTLFFDCDNCERQHSCRCRTLLMYSRSPILYLYRCRLATGSCPWLLFKGTVTYMNRLFGHLI